MENGRLTKKSIIKIIVSVAALALVIAVLVVVLRRNDGIEGLLPGSSAPAAEEFFYDDRGNSVFCPIGGGLGVVSDLGVQIFDRSGTEVHTSSFRLDDPAVSAGDGFFAAWNVSGSTVHVFSPTGPAYTASPGTGIISAKMDGTLLSVCSKWDGGYSSAVTVYNKNGNALFRWYCSSGYAFAARADEASSTLAVLSLTDRGSEVVMLDMTTGDETRRTLLEGVIPVDMRLWSDGAVTVVGRDGISVVTSDGSCMTVDYGGRYLVGCSLSGSGFGCVITAEHASGGGAKLTCLESAGGVVGTVSLPDGASRVSCAGSYTAVLHGEGVSLYGGALELIGTYTAPDGARELVVYENCRVTAAGDYSARVFSGPAEEGGN